MDEYSISQGAGWIMLGIGLLGGGVLTGAVNYLCHGEKEKKLKESMRPVSLSKPKQQDEGDANGYLVLKLKDGSTVPFVRQADGNYIRLDDAHKAKEQGLIKKLE